jgi:hypothetical protein
MIWIFERDDQAVRVETRLDKETGEYVASIEWADGRTDTERYTELHAFQERLSELERTLTAERWRQVGGPTLIRKDWWEGSATES